MDLVLTVSGKIGAGKTTHAEWLARIYGLRYFSSGLMFRLLAAQQRLSLEDFHKLAEKDLSYDLKVDRMLVEEAKKGNVVLDGHLSGWMAKDVADVKIYVTAPLEVRARRLADRDGRSFEEALREVKLREESNRRRYRELYGINLDDLGVYDIVINTDKWPKESVAKILKTVIDEYIKHR